MEWIALLCILVLLYFCFVKRGADLSVLPEKFVVFDFETTGLNPSRHEIVEIGAIRVHRDSHRHDTFEVLVRPQRKLPKKITEITGITQSMVDRDGQPLGVALEGFLNFIGDLPLVAFNAEFDMSFLEQALVRCNRLGRLGNQVSCALKMARRAWPGRRSYRLSDLSKDGGLSLDGEHRALGDCQRALIVYSSAAVKLRRSR